MPPVFRPMFAVDDAPVIGDGDNQLGVRSTGPRTDVTVDRDGNVAPGKGMSVCRDWRKLPPLLIPQRHWREVHRAAGSDDMLVFRLEDRDFETGLIDDHLYLRWDKKNHGLIEPADIMTLAAYQHAIADTAPRWMPVLS